MGFFEDMNKMRNNCCQRKIDAAYEELVQRSADDRARRVREADDAYKTQMRKIRDACDRNADEFYAADDPVDSDRDKYECRVRELVRERFAAYQCRERKVEEAHQEQTREDKVNLAKRMREFDDAFDCGIERRHEAQMRET